MIARLITVSSFSPGWGQVILLALTFGNVAIFATHIVTTVFYSTPEAPGTPVNITLQIVDFGISDLQEFKNQLLHYINLTNCFFDSTSSFLQAHPEYYPQQLKVFAQLNTEIKVYIDQLMPIYMKIEETGVYTAEQVEVFKQIVWFINEYLVDSEYVSENVTWWDDFRALRDGFKKLIKFHKIFMDPEGASQLVNRNWTIIRYDPQIKTELYFSSSDYDKFVRQFYRPWKDN